MIVFPASLFFKAVMLTLGLAFIPDAGQTFRKNHKIGQPDTPIASSSSAPG
jgi:hypothetical protein